jgi:diaminopimelate decarboxylase
MPSSWLGSSVIQSHDLNVGGGLGIRYVESDDPPSIDAWVKVVAEAVTLGVSRARS